MLDCGMHMGYNDDVSKVVYLSETENRNRKKQQVDELHDMDSCQPIR